MALPREKDPYESYTDQIVYFSARLAANPETASLAEPVDKLLSELDADNEAIRIARRAEIRARAQRDHQDDGGDERVRRFKRRVDAIDDPELTERLFPRGLNHAIAPRGRLQIDRLSKLVQAIDDLAASPRVAAHADVDEIKEILGKGKTSIVEALDQLIPVIEAWEVEVLDVARAVDTLGFRRADGVGRLGAVLGELRAKLGGDAKAAYAFTQQGRSSGTADDDEAESEAAA